MTRTSRQKEKNTQSKMMKAEKICKINNNKKYNIKINKLAN